MRQWEWHRCHRSVASTLSQGQAGPGTFKSEVLIPLPAVALCAFSHSEECDWFCNRGIEPLKRMQLVPNSHSTNS